MVPAGSRGRKASLAGTASHRLRWGVPYRVDLRNVSHDALDRLIELGAMDAEIVHDGGLAALMPDNVAPEQIASALGVHDISISPAEGRDAGSVWLLSPRAIRIGRLQIVPAHAHADADALRLIDAAAFGTGRHATTALCLEALEEVIQSRPAGLCSRRRDRVGRAGARGLDDGRATSAGHRHRR